MPSSLLPISPNPYPTPPFPLLEALPPPSFSHLLLSLVPCSPFPAPLPQPPPLVPHPSSTAPTLTPPIHSIGPPPPAATTHDIFLTPLPHLCYLAPRIDGPIFFPSHLSLQFHFLPCYTFYLPPPFLLPSKEPFLSSPSSLLLAS